jgi:hypothetical protein
VSETAGKQPPVLGKILKKEALLLFGLLFFGLAVLPVAIWFVGDAVFGAYGGSGYSEFYGELSSKIREGDIVAWFLVLSPWLVWQSVRLMALGWRATAKL